MQVVPDGEMKVPAVVIGILPSEGAQLRDQLAQLLEGQGGYPAVAKLRDQLGPAVAKALADEAAADVPQPGAPPAAAG